MRLVYVYHSDGAASPGTNIKIDPKQQATNKYIKGFEQEGWFFIFHHLLAANIVDQILMVIESTRGTGVYWYNDLFKVLVIPNLETIHEHIRPDDIFYIRGGHKTWYPVLERLTKNHWLIYYDANTGRFRWPFWDIILDDLTEQQTVDSRGMLHLMFNKPVHPDVFFPIFARRKYDLMIGSSNIHSKKGQWKAVKAVIAFKKKYGINLKCVMPGTLKREGLNIEMLDEIKAFRLDVKMPGFVLRQDLNILYNESKLYIHMGAGCNDRGLLEALRCGCTCLISQPERHEPVAVELSKFIWHEDEEKTASMLKHHLSVYNERDRHETEMQYNIKAGWMKTLPTLITLLNKLKVIKKNSFESVAKVAKGLKII